ncbi:hypothetical protein C4D60_Mb11t01870 [Musa balbisiana]|uniref:Uncharacterized protein n=1 Tax=Musa balbisiana TaxID=52838 RepID=A0A4S8J146_MUSBA|nr:hypothetical protein C4D60_Mb11t01870 [Musa balbisiana]
MPWEASIWASSRRRRRDSGAKSRGKVDAIICCAARSHLPQENAFCALSLESDLTQDDAKATGVF